MCLSETLTHAIVGFDFLTGDRLDTDIAFGNRAGIHTCLVMSGVTSKAELERVDNTSDLYPTFILDSAAELHAK